MPDETRGPAPSSRWRFWLVAAALFVLVLWLLNDVLLPFVVGAVVAYFFNPLVARIERRGMSRTWATAYVTILAVLIFLAAAIAVLPPLFSQMQDLIAHLPQYAQAIISRAQPMIEPMRERFGLEPMSIQDIQAEAGKWVGQTFAIAGTVVQRVAAGSFAAVNFLALLFLTPVVTFYLLRDWEKFLNSIDGVLPRDSADTIRQLAREADGAIAGYLRGQALVCVCLGTIYAVGLTLVGLKFGFVVGLVAGVISFIPFVGTWTGAIMAIGLALAQFSSDWMGVTKVAVVFIVGQILEGNVLSPKLVGDRVGLHPVWIMFALLAGGSLFGFVGVLIAVPLAAVIGVLVRHMVGRYRESDIYRGSSIG